MIPILQEKALDTTPVVEKVHLDMTQAIPMLLGTTQMIPTTHSEKVPTLTPTTPMLLDMIQTILPVARALLDMTLMIPILQEKPLDTTPVVEKVHLDMTQAIPMLLDTIQMIPTTHSEKVPTLTPTTPMLLDM